MEENVRIRVGSTAGAQITVDDELSLTSEDPVQNKVITAALNGKQDALTIDSTLSLSSEDPVQNKVITAALNGKQDALTPQELSGLVLTAFVPQMHRNIFRGKYLGAEVTSGQSAAITDGSFDDIYVGDYWTINNITYRVADMDRYLGTGDIPLTAHHLVIVPDESMYNVNASRINDLYINSPLRTTGLADARTTINAAFPGMVLTYRNHFEGSNFTNADVEVMSQLLLLGCLVQPQSSNLPHRLDISQLALFALAPEYIRNAGGYWLRDPDTRANTYFVYINSNGILADDDGAANQHGVRPYFLIGGTVNE